MKIWLIKHSGTKNFPQNFEAWPEVVKSVQAFLKKKHAKEYIAQICKGQKYLSPEDREIITVTI